MAGTSRIHLNNEVPICLLLSDGASGQYPRATVRDNDDNVLTALNLSHVSDGLYTPSASYLMPSEDFIKTTYVVFSDSMHTIESTIYLRDIDVFQLVDPDDYKADVSNLATSAQVVAVQTDLDNPDQYKADVSALAPSGEYNARLAEIQLDLDNPDQYKADVSGLATSAQSVSIQLDLDNSDQYKADVSGLAPSGEYDVRMQAIQLDLDTPDQYKADVSGLAPSGEYDVRLSSINTDLKQILGLVHSNIFIDHPVYDNSNLKSARVRIYSVPGSVGTGNDVIGTYAISAPSIVAGQFQTWSQIVSS